jgi:hypothetical protein
MSHLIKLLITVRNAMTINIIRQNSVLYNQGTEYISTLLSEWQNQYEVIITKQKSTIYSLFKHDINNIKIITETGGVGYSYNQLQIEYDKLRKCELVKVENNSTGFYTNLLKIIAGNLVEVEDHNKVEAHNNKPEYEYGHLDHELFWAFIHGTQKCYGYKYNEYG